jgi:hypothetical protein
MAIRIAHWRNAWVALALALGLHVTDEALTGFLPFYNSLVESIRAEHPSVVLPTFTFPVWLAGLILGILLLLALTLFVSRGARWIRVASVILGVLMTGNAVGHIAASVYWSKLVPGVYSSPLLFIASIALVVTALRAKVRGAGRCRTTSSMLLRVTMGQGASPPIKPA